LSFNKSEQLKYRKRTVCRTVMGTTIAGIIKITVMFKYGILLFTLFAAISLSWDKSDFCATKNSYFPIISDTSVCDKVFDGKYIDSNHITSISLGGASPGQKIRIIIKEKDRNNFPSPPEKLYTGKTVCVKGPVEVQDSQPSIVVTDPGQIVVQQ
jgi:hypothetical protein